MSELELPTDPAALAAERAQLASATDFDIQLHDEFMLAELEHGAQQLGFMNQTYFVEAGRSVVLPSTLETGKSVKYVDIFGLTFEGKFAAYAKVHIGKIIGGQTVRAVCLMFDEATLLPYLDTLPEDQLLYVPALAVNSIQKTE
jgi:hypothetical protein